MSVSNCTLKEGTTPVELAMADSKWNEYLDSIDSEGGIYRWFPGCLLYTSPSPRDLSTSRMPSSA